MKRQNGYTLLELLVVLAIMAILVGAIPGVALSGIQAVRFSGKVQEVISRLSEAQEKAVETGQTIILQPSDFSDMNVVVTMPPLIPQIKFFPDGSAYGQQVILNYLGRKETLTVDSITGRVRAL